MTGGVDSAESLVCVICLTFLKGHMSFETENNCTVMLCALIAQQ